jgi:hypothetical protein
MIKFMTIAELNRYADENPTEWLVDQLFKEASFNICAGGPKSGKSSLMRQLAVAVSRGEPFLDCPTKQGDVLYLCPDEQDATELRRSFNQLGAGDGVLVSTFPVNRYSLIADLKDAILEHPQVSLIVLDTLEKTVSMEDLNDYIKTLSDLEPLVCFATEHKLTVVGTHHTNKRQSTSVSGAMMGSNGLGSVATTSLEVLVDHAGKRYLRSMQRYSRELERTELHFDPFRLTFSLGQSESSKSKEKAIFKVKDLQKRIMDFICSNPSTQQKAITDAIPANKQQILRELKEMEAKGVITTKGTGRRNNPTLYFPAAIPMEASPGEIAA